MKLPLDQRPVIVAIAGPNGAGKSTFYHAHLKPIALRFLNADVVAKELNIDAYAAAKIVARLRDELIEQRESFVFETVFSDPVGDKLEFLKKSAQSGYTVVLCFIGIRDVRTSEVRVAMRVSQGGHDVPTKNLNDRFPRILVNLKSAIRELPHVWIFDNSDLRVPFRQVAIFESGRLVSKMKAIPKWLNSLLK